MGRFLVAFAICFTMAVPMKGTAQTVGEAVDNETLIWGTSGASTAPWYGQTAVTHDGVDAARSGAITHGQQSDLTVNVTGPGTLTFWWKVSSEYDGAAQRYDKLLFWYDESSGMRTTYGEVQWQPNRISLPPGPHALNWRYVKDASGTAGMDAAFIDQVTWTPGPELAPELGELLWSKSEHMGIGHNYIRGVEFDTQGNLVVAGFFQTTGTSTSSSDAHIKVLSPDGEQLVWEDIFNSNATESVDRFYTAKRDSAGNIITAGNVNGVYPPYHTAMLIRKYDPEGAFDWERRYNIGAWSDVQSMGIDSDDNIYVAGRAFGSWGTQEGMWCILKYSPEGTLQSGYPITYNVSSFLNSPDVANGLAVDQSGNIYAVGQIGVTPSNTYDWHVRSYAPDRSLRWTDTISTFTVGVDIANAAVLDGEGHLFVCGRIWNGTNNDMHVVKYLCDPDSSTSVRVWERSYASDFEEKNGNATTIAIAPDGAIYAGGTFVDGADLNQAALLRLHPANGDVLDRQVSDLPTQSVLMSLAFRKRQLGWGGTIHNGTDWDYMYGMLVVPPGPMDSLIVH